MATQWTTIALPTDLYNEVLRFHVENPDGHVDGHRSKAKSVPEYVRFWVRLGSLVDRALAANPDASTLAAALAEVVNRAREDT